MLDYMERAGAIARFFLPCGNTVRRKNIIEKSARNPAYLGRLPAGAAVARVNSGLRERGRWNDHLLGKVGMRGKVGPAGITRCIWSFFPTQIAFSALREREHPPFVARNSEIDLSAIPRI